MLLVVLEGTTHANKSHISKSPSALALISCKHGGQQQGKRVVLYLFIDSMACSPEKHVDTLLPELLPPDKRQTDYVYEKEIKVTAVDWDGLWKEC